MPTTIYYSNRLEELALQLGKNIRNSPCGIFTKEYIITQTAGMSQWLCVEMARKENNGVFANFALVNQDGFLHEVYALLTGKQAQYNFETSKWILYRLLGSEDFIKEIGFENVTRYYKEDDLKRIQLAAGLNDLFDQYQVYREDMIKTWDEGRLADAGSVTEKWQRWLWVRLNASGHFYAKNKMKQEILQALESEENRAKIELKFPVINFFGNSIYNRYHLEIYDRLAKIIRVNHFITVPVKNITDTVPYENELLQSLGGKSRELFELIKPDVFLSREAAFIDLTVEPGAARLLTLVQEQIFRNLPVAMASKIKDDLLLDNSIQINSAYTEAREVEMLYNYLVDLVNRNKGLNPKDITVLATDIDLYAPYIRAVFSNPPFYIPYKISGVSKGQKESILTALVKILDFDEDDFTSEKVISLLESRPVATRYGIGDTESIRAMVDKANIRFGREGRKADDTQYVSWNYGLQKLAFGYAMLSDDSYQVPGKEVSLYPFEDIEGKSGQDIFRLKAFVDDLGGVIDARKKARPLDGWKAFVLEEALEKMIAVEDEDQDDLSHLYRQFRRLEESENILGEAVDFRMYYLGLKSALLEESGEYGFNSGKVTFTSHIPARGLPSKVIAFLGLNSGKFPRKDKFAGYDLIARERLLGDRSKKDNDKQLFLDTLLASREYLYLSYIGRSVKDNSLIPPSIAVDVLLDYLENMALDPSKVRNGLLAEHPLHGFSGKYQAGESRLFSYLYGLETDGKYEEIYKVQDNPEAEEFMGAIEIRLQDLVSFYKSPIKWFYQKSLGLYFGEDENLLQESELCVLNNLELWELKNELLNIDISDIELLDKFRDQKVKCGKLPLKTFSEITIGTLIEDVKPVSEKKESLTSGEKALPINNILTLKNGLVLTGSVTEVYGNNLIAWSFSKNPLKYKVEARIRYLFLRASGHDLTVRFISRDGEDTAFPKLTQQQALDYLQLLSEYFIKGTREAILFTQASAEAYLADHDIDKAVKIVEEEANGNSFSDLPENPYLQKAFSDELFNDLSDFEQHLGDLAPALLNF